MAGRDKRLIKFQLLSTNEGFMLLVDIMGNLIIWQLGEVTGKK